ncbi:hypothetical protein CGRA01v4_07800 [Colletotrichum graminicola]|nr:hypothetical protein CGRA01v4_07800 [Colletotrichum graminicola]
MIPSSRYQAQKCLSKWHRDIIAAAPDYHRLDHIMDGHSSKLKVHQAAWVR